MNITDIIAAIISAVISSMGLGGGGVLILYLTIFKNTKQLLAQGKNLFFFIPCAIVSIIVYNKSKLIKFKRIFPIMIGGIFGVVIGNFAIKIIPESIIRIVFSIFLLVNGITTIFQKKDTQQNK